VEIAELGGGAPGLKIKVKLIRKTGKKSDKIVEGGEGGTYLGTKRDAKRSYRKWGLRIKRSFPVPAPSHRRQGGEYNSPQGGISKNRKN